MKHAHRHFLLAVLVGLCAQTWPCLAQYSPQNPGAAGPQGVDQPMLLDPELIQPEPNRVFSPRLKELWLAALARPDIDTRRMAAAAIRQAHQQGMQGLAEAGPILMGILSDKSANDDLRLDVVRTLIVLDHRDAGAAFLDLDRDGYPELIQTIDPVLAQWCAAPRPVAAALADQAKALWLKRMDEPLAPDMVRIWAMQSLATVGDRRAAPSLARIATDSNNAVTLRLAAARALGVLAQDGLLEQATTLAQGAMIDHLCAACMLAGHRGAPVQALLRKLALDAEPTVASTALRRLVELDANLVDSDLTAQLAKNRDANVRLYVITAAVGQKTAASIAFLGTALDDENPKLRVLARDSLIALAAQADLDQPVRQAAMDMLNKQDAQAWRGLEQAAYVLGALDHEAAADRLIDLFAHARPEPRLAATVALRRLAIAQTLPALLQRAEQLAQKKDGGVAADLAGGDELTQLFQTFGQLKHAPAEALMRKFIDKNSGYTGMSRQAAIWALGHLHDGQPDARLAGLLAGRLSDVNPLAPEATEVRRMSAVSIGRMKAKGQLGALRKFYEQEKDTADIGGACRWAIIQITGQDMPPLKAVDQPMRGWFLEPSGE
ncbi:MAG: hypothetical protein WD042_19975 [Phycisphaeraceae bacterium]